MAQGQNLEEALRKRLIELLEAEYGSASMSVVYRLETIIRLGNNMSYKHGHDDAIREAADRKREGKVVDLFGARNTDEQS